MTTTTTRTEENMNTRRLAKKLQTALCLKGRHIKINQYQSYSAKSERMVTKFVLQEVQETPNGKRKSVTLLETYQMADVVMLLAKLYEELNETDA